MEQSFDRPIPGMGMTFEVGSRPWQTPPEITTVEQATNYYVERMNTDQFKAQLVDVIEMGVPLATLANTIQLASVMEGVHSVDVGMLVIPIIVELLMTIAEAEGVQYQTGMEGMETERPTAVSRIINDKMNELRAPTEDIGIEEPQVELEQAEQPQPMGLMARRV
tara:strand:- start:1069 stop:1563 length:495 start_codon:yes stop_codon:yes gene_type:complete